MKRKKYSILAWGFHFAYFGALIYSIIFVYKLSISDFFTTNFFLKDIFEALLASTVVYTYYFSIYKKEILLRNKFFWLLFFLIIFLCFSFVKATMKRNDPFDDLIPFFLHYVGYSTLLFVYVWVSNHLELIFNNKLFTIIKKNKAAKEMILRRQLSPHFLFNSLNSIYSLSLNNSQKMPDAVLKLSNIMRYLTDYTSQEKVPLVDEIEFIKSYIAFEKIRLGDEARIHYVIEGGSEDLFIAPFLLFTLVENVFKHGDVSKEKAVFIKLSIEGNRVKLKTYNKLLNPGMKMREGKGLTLLEERLRLIYNKNYKLKILTNKHSFFAKLEINKL